MDTTVNYNKMDINNSQFTVPSVPARWNQHSPENQEQRGHRGGVRGSYSRPHRGSYHSPSGRHDSEHYGQPMRRGRGNFRGRSPGQDGGRGHGYSGRPNKRPKPYQPRPVPEIKVKFYCCACDRAFKTQEEKDEHDSEHIVCGLDGCQFEAHALVVTKHVKMQHADGLYERIKSLKTPEDIKLWKEERKKNFPTLDNIQKKDDERKEQQERREICGSRGRSNAVRPMTEEPLFRYKIPPADKVNQMQYNMERKFQKIEQDQGDAWRHRSFAPDINARHIRVPFASMSKSPIVTLESLHLNVKQGKDGKLEKKGKAKWKGFKVKAMERLPDSDEEMEGEALPISDSDGEDCDMEVGSEAVLKTKPQTETKIDEQETKTVDSQTMSLLGGLALVTYSSASESDNEDNVSEAASHVIVPSSSTSNHVQENDDQNLSNGKSLTDDEGDEDSESDSDIVIEEFGQNPLPKPKTVPLFQRRTVRNAGRNRNYLRSRLLERLLQDPIRRERNIILQVCRFFCENNFFIDEKTNSSSETKLDTTNSGSTPSEIGGSAPVLTEVAKGGSPTLDKVGKGVSTPIEVGGVVIPVNEVAEANAGSESIGNQVAESEFIGNEVGGDESADSEVVEGESIGNEVAENDSTANDVARQEAITCYRGLRREFHIPGNPDIVYEIDGDVFRAHEVAEGATTEYDIIRYPLMSRRDFVDGVHHEAIPEIIQDVLSANIDSIPAGEGIPVHNVMIIAHFREGESKEE